MRAVILDGRNMTDRESAHRELAQRLEFADYYGANLDALWDLLTTCGETTVKMTYAGAMLSALRGYGCKLLETFFEAEEENPSLHFEVSSGE